MARNMGGFKAVHRNWVVIATLLMIFLAIAVHGGEYVSHAAAVLAGVFLLACAVALRSPFEARSIAPKILLPLLLLAAYSFLQGILPLLVEANGMSAARYMPYGFDPISSLWSAAKIAAFICLVGLSLVSLGRARDLFVGGLIVVGTSFALFGIVRLLLQTFAPEMAPFTIADELRPGVGFGTFLNQNHFAMLMLMTMGLSAGMMLMANLAAGKKLLLALASLLAWTALVLTASRGGIIGSFFVVATLMIFHIGFRIVRRRDDETPRSKEYLSIAKSIAASAVIIAALAAGVVFVGQDYVVERFAELPEQLEGTPGPAFRRADVWEAAVRMIEHYPVFGVGFGGFQYAVSRQIDTSGDVVPRQAHNDYLELFASGGIVAAGLFAWFLYGVILETRSGFRSSGDSTATAARVGAVCGIVGVGFHSFTDFGLQYAGNEAFFAALIAIAIWPSRGEGTPGTSTGSPRATVLPVILFGLFAVSLVFSAARYSLGRIASTERPAITIPFDAETHSVLAARLVSAGEIGSAITELRTAASLRGQDYQLWLRLAKAEAQQGNHSAADHAYRTALELAPMFGQPHFLYGTFLAATSRTDESVRELVFAARRDSRYTEPVLAAIWGKTPEFADHVVSLFNPARADTRATITNFLLAKKEFDVIASISCLAELSDFERDVLSRQLIEERRYRDAWRVYAHLCDPGDQDSGFIDGDFEKSQIRKGFGFGWIAADALDRAALGIDRTVKTSGVQSLRFTLEGYLDQTLLKQTIPINGDSRYTVTFAHRSRGVVSGGGLVLEIIAHTAETSVRVVELELLHESADWQRPVLSFDSPERAEAIEVVIKQRPCGHSKCPMFGQLWLDDFRLERLLDSSGTDSPRRTSAKTNARQ